MKFACECGETLKVCDTRKSGDVVRRRYKCERCNLRATTVEFVLAYDMAHPSETEAKARMSAIKSMLFGESCSEVCSESQPSTQRDGHRSSQAWEPHTPDG